MRRVLPIIFAALSWLAVWEATSQTIIDGATDVRQRIFSLSRAYQRDVRFFPLPTNLWWSGWAVVGQTQRCFNVEIDGFPVVQCVSEGGSNVWLDVREITSHEWRHKVESNRWFIDDMNNDTIDTNGYWVTGPQPTTWRRVEYDNGLTVLLPRNGTNVPSHTVAATRPADTPRWPIFGADDGDYAVFHAGPFEVRIFCAGWDKKMTGVYWRE